MEKGDGNKKDKNQFFFLIGMMVLTGASNTIFLSLQNDTSEFILGAKFQHPWYQSIMMFTGEAYCMIFWLIWGKVILAKEDQEALEKDGKIDDRPDASIFHYLIASGCDVVGSTLLNFALIMMATSIFQMMRGGIIIITCIFSILFLKKYPTKHQWIGVGIVFLGIFIVGVSAKLNETEAYEFKVIGFVMMLASLTFNGFQYVYEEIIMTKYRVSPLQLVAWEGIWGFLIFLVLLPIFEFIPCNFNGKEDVCSPLPDKRYFLENTWFGLKQTFDNPVVALSVVLQTFSICGFNYFGIALVRFSTSATRAVMDNTRTVLVWVFFLFYPYTYKGTESFDGLQLSGFILLLVGQLIYNRIFIIDGIEETQISVNPPGEETKLLPINDSSHKLID